MLVKNVAGMIIFVLMTVILKTVPVALKQAVR
jgi:hypothetical protein